MDPLVEAIGRGEFDSLFDKGTHRLSELLRAAHDAKPWPGPTVELAASAPFKPLSYDLPKYGPLAMAARLGGEVTFTLEVTPEGGVANPNIVSGNPLFRGSVLSAVGGWKFPLEAAGTEIRATLKFETNCAPAKP